MSAVDLSYQNRGTYLSLDSFPNISSTRVTYCSLEGRCDEKEIKIDKLISGSLVALGKQISGLHKISSTFTLELSLEKLSPQKWCCFLISASRVGYVLNKRLLSENGSLEFINKREVNEQLEETVGSLFNRILFIPSLDRVIKIKFEIPIDE